MEENKMKLIMAFIMGFAFLIIGTIIAFVLVSNVAEIEEDVTGLGSASDDQNILSDNGTSTSFTTYGTGVTGVSATRHNQTWLEFDGVNDLVIFNNNSEFNINTSTVLAWIKPNNNSNNGRVVSKALSYDMYLDGGTIKGTWAGLSDRLILLFGVYKKLSNIGGGL